MVLILSSGIGLNSEREFWRDILRPELLLIDSEGPERDSSEAALDSLRL